MRKAKGSGFKMRSGNTTSFKMMGSSSPVKNVDPSYYSNLIGNLQLSPTPTPPRQSPVGESPSVVSGSSNAAQQAADRQAEIDAFNAAGGLSQAQNFDPTTGQFDPTGIDYSLYQPSVSTMYSEAGSQQSADAYQWYLDNYGNTPNNQMGDNNSIAASSSDLQKDLTDKLQEEEAEEYNPEAYQGSLYDHSVRKRTPMSKKRSPKGKRGYKMKRK